MAINLFRSPKTKAVSVFVLVLIDRLSPWVEFIALKKPKVSDGVSAVRDVWMPKHGVPVALLLFDNGVHTSLGVLLGAFVNTWGKKDFQRFIPPPKKFPD